MYDKPLSYSSLKLYERCPKLFLSVKKNEATITYGPAADRGTTIHGYIEDYFNGRPYNKAERALKPWRGYFDNLRVLSPEPECEVAVDSLWQPVDYDDPSAYFRGRLDLRYVVDSTCYIKDWKTGKEYPDHPRQGLSYIALNPGFEEYRVEFVYLDQYPLVRERVYDRTDFDAAVSDLVSQIRIVRADEEFAATPSMNSCHNCPLNWRVGGGCKDAP